MAPSVASDDGGFQKPDGFHSRHDDVQYVKWGSAIRSTRLCDVRVRAG